MCSWKIFFIKTIIIINKNFKRTINRKKTVTKTHTATSYCNSLKKERFSLGECLKSLSNWSLLLTGISLQAAAGQKY